MTKKQLAKKLNKEFTKNPNFIFYDFENECVGKDLLELTHSLLSQQKENLMHDILEVIWEEYNRAIKEKKESNGYAHSYAIVKDFLTKQ